MARPLKILACMFQGGGNIPVILPVLAELVARDHRVRVMARISEGYFALNLRCMADHSSSAVVLLAGGSESTGNGKQLLQLQHGAIRCREDRPTRCLGDQRRRWRHAVLREGNQIAVAQVP
jgi:hypothetical protein